MEHENYTKWEYEKTCPECGSIFIANRRDHKYCDQRCKQVAYYKRHHQYQYQIDERSDLEILREEYKSLSASHSTLFKKMGEYKKKYEAVLDISIALSKEKQNNEKRILLLETQLKKAKETIVKIEASVSVRSTNE